MAATTRALAPPDVRRYRHYGYLRKDGEVVWFCLKKHKMLLEHPNWMPRFHVLRTTGESRLMGPIDHKATKQGVEQP